MTPAAIIAAELNEPVPPPAGFVAAELARHGTGAVAAVLFYGSNLRSGAVDGVLDFYVLVDDLQLWHRSRPLALATRLLPPTVEYWEVPWQGHLLRAKVAVLATDQFARALQSGALDTTIWARFTQPVMLPFVRDDATRTAVGAMLAQAVATAARWAALLGPAEGPALLYWETLFRATYGAELRVEKGERGASLVSHAQDRYQTLLPLAWQQAGLAYESLDGGALRPRLSPAVRARGRRGWAWRRRLGKWLNIARLTKAAFTFKGGADYIAWKIERHSGVRLNLSPWQRRHPLLSAPAILWRLRRLGTVR